MQSNMPKLTAEYQATYKQWRTKELTLLSLFKWRLVEMLRYKGTGSYDKKSLAIVPDRVGEMIAADDFIAFREAARNIPLVLGNATF